MTAAFLTILPIFAVIALGWATTRFRLIGERTGEGLTDYVFVIAIPLMLFRTLASAKLPDVQPWPYWLSYFLALATVWILTAQITQRLFSRSKPESVVMGFASGQANTVLIGIPLLTRVYGDAALVPMLLLIAVHTPITITAATLLVESAGEGGGRIRSVVSKLVRNPLLISLAAGTFYRMTGWPIPDPALVTLKFIGDSAAPCALFAMGAALTRYGFGGEPRLLSLIVLMKLIVQPLGVYLLATRVLPVPPVWAAVGTLFAACPCGVNAYLLAQRYRIGMGLTSGAIAVSTIVSIATLTVWVAIIRG